MDKTPQYFTAARIAAVLSKSPQAVRKGLRETPPTGLKIVAGNESAAWSFASLPVAWRNEMSEAAQKLGYCDAESMLNAAPAPWAPELPLDKIADEQTDYARKLRDALRPWFTQQHQVDMTSAELEARGVEDYRRIFGHAISGRYWRELFMRTLKRDGGAENWNRLEIYLPVNLKRKSQQIVSEAIAEVFESVESFIGNVSGEPTAQQKQDIWALALQNYRDLAGRMPEKKAAKLTRQFLFSRAPFLAGSRESLLKTFGRKLKQLQGSDWNFKALDDGRSNNGNRATVPEEDMDRLRASAAFKNGRRIDAAWREEYEQLSEQTRTRWQFSLQAPRKIHELLNRDKVDALWLRHQGKRALRTEIGGVERDRSGLCSMAAWVVDDMTSNIEVAGREPHSLFQPQIVSAFDVASRKFVGWAESDDKGPTAELSCEAVLSGIKSHGVPKELGVENGFVFGRSLNINGKTDEQGRSVVGGLARYGCKVVHFGKMNPRSKSELEKAFDFIQRLMERHPGYAGRLQMVDAPEDFKREQRLIKAEKAKATDFRYTFEQFTEVMRKIFLEYNAAPQEALGGLSPDEAFEAWKDKSDPPIQFTPELEWLLSNERYIVNVEVGGVWVPHYGRRLRVRGGRLTQLVGKELWALVDRQDDSLVTFMNLDFTEPFTMEVCQRPSIRERLLASGSGVLAAEVAKVREHERALDEDYKDLLQRYGNPRRDLLLAAQQPQPARIAVVPKRMAEAAVEMDKQRGEIKATRERGERLTRTVQSRARKLGFDTGILNGRIETSDEGTALMLAAKKEHQRKQNNQEEQSI